MDERVAWKLLDWVHVPIFFSIHLLIVYISILSIQRTIESFTGLLQLLAVVLGVWLTSLIVATGLEFNKRIPVIDKLVNIIFYSFPAPFLWFYAYMFFMREPVSLSLVRIIGVGLVFFFTSLSITALIIWGREVFGEKQ